MMNRFILKSTIRKASESSVYDIEYFGIYDTKTDSWLNPSWSDFSRSDICKKMSWQKNLTHLCNLLNIGVRTPDNIERELTEEEIARSECCEASKVYEKALRKYNLAKEELQRAADLLAEAGRKHAVAMKKEGGE